MTTSALRAADIAAQKEQFSKTDTKRMGMLKKIYRFISEQLSPYGDIYVVEGKDFTPSTLEIDVTGDFTKPGKLEDLMQRIKQYVVCISKNKVFCTKSENERKLIFSILEGNATDSFSVNFLLFPDFLKIQKMENKNAETPNLPRVAKGVIKQEVIKKPFLEFLQKELIENLNELRKLIEFRISISVEKGAVLIKANSPSGKKRINDFLLSFVDFSYDISESYEPNTIIITGKSFTADNSGPLLISTYSNLEKNFYFRGEKVELFRSSVIMQGNVIITKDDYTVLIGHIRKNNKEKLTFLLEGSQKFIDIYNSEPNEFLNKTMEKIYLSCKIENSLFKGIDFQKNTHLLTDEKHKMLIGKKIGPEDSFFQIKHKDFRRLKIY